MSAHVPLNDAVSSSTAGSAKKEAMKQQLNADLPPEEAHLLLTEVIGLKDNTFMFIKHILLCIIFSIFYVLWWSWWPATWYKFRFMAIADGTLDKADYVLVTDKMKRQTLCKVEYCRPVCEYDMALGKFQDDQSYMQSDFHMDKMFMYRNRRYIYNPTTDMFELLHCPKYMDPKVLHARGGATGVACKGMDITDFADNGTLYGRNILQIPAPSLPELFLHEFLQPFFCFQVYSVIVWFLIEYYTCMFFFLFQFL